MGPYNGVVEVIWTMSSCITLNSMMVRPSSAMNPGTSEAKRLMYNVAEPHTQFSTKIHVQSEPRPPGA